MAFTTWLSRRLGFSKEYEITIKIAVAEAAIATVLAAVASASAITLRAFAIVTVIALPATWPKAGPPAFGRGDMLAVINTGVVTAGIASLLFSNALRHIDPASGVTLALGEPVVAFALSVLVLGESPSAMAHAGLMVVMAGVLLAIRQELRGTVSARVAHL